VSVGATMSHGSTRYDLLARLLEYPGPNLARLAAGAAGERPGDKGLAAFAAWAEAADPRGAEELYTRAFDLHAPCCLEVGWQLFGESYKRGSFLVRLRQAARRHGVGEGTELPDHLIIVLRLLGRLGDDEDPRGLVEEAIVPALVKMQAGLDAAGDDFAPYRALLAAVQGRLCADFGVAPAPAAHRPEAARLPVLHEVLP